MADITIPPKISAIIEHLHTQDNRITSHPLFAVQQKRTIGGLDEDYASRHAWVDSDGECSPEESNLYDAKRENGEPLPDGVRRLGFIEIWEFVTGCMTEQGCKDFITINGHNLKEPRIYAYSGYRNAEFIAVREWLMSLRATCVDAPHQPNVHEQRLRAVLDVVQRYLPPDGIHAHDAMTEIIGLVDPWPAGAQVCHPPDLGARYSVEFDGFVGTVIGGYKRLDGEEGVVMQQDGCKVVHVYRRKWLKPTDAVKEVPRG